MHELTLHQPEINPVTTISKPPIQKYSTGQPILFKENGRIPNLEPHWTGLHAFTSSEGSKHAKHLLAAGSL